MQSHQLHRLKAGPVPMVFTWIPAKIWILTVVRLFKYIFNSGPRTVNMPYIGIQVPHYRHCTEDEKFSVLLRNSETAELRRVLLQENF